MNSARFLACFTLLLLQFGCSMRSGVQMPAEDSGPHVEISSGPSVRAASNPPGVWSGATMAGPSSPQDFADWTNPSMAAWGPVVQNHVVPLPGGGTTIVKQLACPDPFTPMYQLANGCIVHSALPLTRIVDPNYAQVLPPLEPWSDNGEACQIYSGEVLVYFEPTATQAQLTSFFAQHGFSVIFSWFEPLPTPAAGNLVAWFQLRYDRQLFASYPAVEAFLAAQQGFVSSVRPNRPDDFAADWGNPDQAWMVDPNDPDYQARNSIYCDALGLLTNPWVRIGPEAGQYTSIQAVAVVDSGVYRKHVDFMYTSNGVAQNKIAWTGVETDHDNIWVDAQRGEPIDHRFSHGTRCAGIITAGTNNATQGASLAPMACVLPIRPYCWIAEDGRERFGSDALVKAYRALRLNFDKNQWTRRVRVVSISIGGADNWSLFPNEDQEAMINADINNNDRLYVASAGNDMAVKKQYPAAYAKVMGVSGLWFDCALIDFYPPWNPIPFPATAWSSTGYLSNGSGPLSGSNSWPANMAVYPISGVYDTENRDAFGLHLSPIPAVAPAVSMLQAHMNGTSAATPQIASLAQALFDKNPGATYTQVENRIVSTRWTYMEANNPGFAGIANFEAALNGW